MAALAPSTRAAPKTFTVGVLWKAEAESQSSIRESFHKRASPGLQAETGGEWWPVYLGLSEFIVDK
jgi:hypothetical protein